MRVLYLGPDSPLVSWLRDQGEEVTRTEGSLRPEDVAEYWPDVVVSYGYRHILPQSVLDELPRPAINLHISLLPWNRGADPNLWSFIEGTPKGVTIHEIDGGVDTGPIIAQHQVHIPTAGTLSDAYSQLHKNMRNLFRVWWPSIREGEYEARPQTPSADRGSYHRVSDRESVEHLLTDGWETRLTQLRKRFAAGAEVPTEEVSA